MTFNLGAVLAVLTAAWGIATKVFAVATTLVKGSAVGSIVTADAVKIGALFVVDAILLVLVLVPFVGVLKSIILIPLCAAIVMIPEIVEAFINGVEGK